MRWGCGGCLFLAICVFLAGLFDHSAIGKLAEVGFGSLAVCFALPFVLVSAKGQFRGRAWLIGLLVTGVASLANLVASRYAQTVGIAEAIIPFGAFLVGAALAALIYGEEST